MLAKCSNRCESGQEVVRVEDGYFSQTEQTEGKGEGSGETISRKCMHRERQRSVSSRHRSPVSISPRFISVQSITDFDRGFYLSIFYYFLAPLEYRSSMELIRVHYLLGVEMVWFMFEGIAINCGRNFAAIFYKELHLHKV